MRFAMVVEAVWAAAGGWGGGGSGRGRSGVGNGGGLDSHMLSPSMIPNS